MEQVLIFLFLLKKKSIFQVLLFREIVYNFFGPRHRCRFDLIDDLATEDDLAKDGSRTILEVFDDLNRIRAIQKTLDLNTEHDLATKEDSKSVITD